MDGIVHNLVEVNGVKLHIAEMGNISSPVVVLFLHGFPEIWYSWRHQMIAIANAGYRAIAPDFRGYGLSDPSPTEEFGFSHLVDDTLRILDSLRIHKEPGRAEADFRRFDVKTVLRNIYILFSRSEIPVAHESQEYGI